MGLGDILDRLFLVEDNPVATRKWRLTISLVCVMFLFHIAWACGLVPTLSGFALAAEQTQMKSDITSIKLQLIEREILDLRVAQCSNPSKRFFTSRINDLRTNWQKETGVPYILPDCGDIQ
jgi:hypothetical protein